MIKIKNIVGPKKKLIRYWLEFLKPYHKLTPREMDVIATMTYYELEMEKGLPKTANRVDIMRSEKVRFSIMDELNMNNSIFNNTLFRLRKKKILNKKNQVRKVLRPPLTDDGFQLLLNFKLDETEGRDA